MAFMSSLLKFTSSFELACASAFSSKTTMSYTLALIKSSLAKEFVMVFVAVLTKNLSSS